MVWLRPISPPPQTPLFRRSRLPARAARPIEPSSRQDCEIRTPASETPAPIREIAQLRDAATTATAAEVLSSCRRESTPSHKQHLAYPRTDTHTRHVALIAPPAAIDRLVPPATPPR